jgi:hypothetical protein
VAKQVLLYALICSKMYLNALHSQDWNGIIPQLPVTSVYRATISAILAFYE